jgi:DNA-binding NarL/FixJ family response regulator
MSFIASQDQDSESVALQATGHRRNVTKVPLPEPSDFDRRQTVLLYGDVFLQGNILRDSVSSAADLTFIRCSDEAEQLFSLCRRLNVSLLVARQTFIEQLSSADMTQLTDYGKSCYVLAILDSDCLETSASKMLRLGCRGVLPQNFPAKLFWRAMLAVLKGELWAPPLVISELLSDLLRAATLKAENGLTPQETRILELSQQGYKNSAIAEALFISLETVRWHKRRLNRKLNARSRHPQAKVGPSTPARQTAAG